MKTSILAILLIFISLAGLCQIPVIEEPKPAQFKTVTVGSPQPNFNTNTTNNSTVKFNNTQTDKTNKAIINQSTVDYYTRKQLVDAVLNEAKAQERMHHNAVKYNLPSYTGKPGANYYVAASGEIADMLNGKTEPDLKKAVFLVENAYFENAMSYEDFSKEIGAISKFCLLYMKQQGYSTNSNLAKVTTLFRYFSDTLLLNVPSLEKTMKNYPYKYDFKDIFGHDDWRKMFVSKLLFEQTGQCHSLPLLFLLVANEMGAKAYLPFHLSIRI